MSDTTSITTVGPPWGLFPPYGFMEANAMSVVTGSGHPPAWRGSAQDYEAWLAGIQKTIQDLIWPVFDWNAKTWSGASVAWMDELTRFDLNVLRKMYTAYPQIIDRPISAPGGMTPLPTHHQLFEAEDMSAEGWSKYLRHYDQNWESDQVDDITAIVRDAYRTKVGSGILRLKYALQRPRPYQMALILGYDDFTYYEALTADTPSMICGHCAQALLLFGAVIERILLSGTSLSPERWAALEQVAVDIGDRRVMARVHYPSDGLASWIMVLSMADHVFATPEVKKHLHSAITKRSVVYQMIEKEGGLYSNILKYF